MANADDVADLELARGVEALIVGESAATVGEVSDPPAVELGGECCAVARHVFVFEHGDARGETADGDGGLAEGQYGVDEWVSGHQEIPGSQGVRGGALLVVLVFLTGGSVT